MATVTLDTVDPEYSDFQTWLLEHNITATPVPAPENNMMGVRYDGKREDLVDMIIAWFDDEDLLDLIEGG